MAFALSILNDPLREQTAEVTARFQSENVLARLRAPNPMDDASLALLGGNGETPPASVLGPFDFPDQFAAHPEWPGFIANEIEALRLRIRRAHDAPIRFLIWAGMGGSMEDKLVYESCGLLKGGPRLYALDSTDPNKLKSIVHDIQERSKLSMPEILKSTLIVGMAMGMTSYEPVVNLEKLAVLYEKNGVDPTPNMLCLTLPGSLLDRFAESRNLTRAPLQMDERNSAAGRHSAPLTRGSLYPLALAGYDLQRWADATLLTAEQIETAWKLAAFLHVQGVAGRDKVTLLLPKAWSGVARWTKQNFEESLGKSEKLGIKIVIDERAKTRFYRKPGDPRQDRVFLAIQLRGEAHPEAATLTELRHMKYPVAVGTFPKTSPIAAWMQFVHYVVLGIAYLREMNFVTQPGVELYKSVAGEIFQVGSQQAWDKLVSEQPRWTADRYTTALRDAVKKGATYAELTFFGDMRYSPEGRDLRRTLETIADRVFRMPLKMPVDISEGPAMNHSYHEMIIGRGGCFSTLIAAARQARFPGAKYEPDYHMAQFIATKIALERRGRAVVPLMLLDLEAPSIKSLQTFFGEVAANLNQPLPSRNGSV